MTRSKAATTSTLFVLAGLAGISHAQQVSVTVSLGDGTIKNLEYNTQQTFTCKWDGDDDLKTASINLNSEALQIKWYYQGNTIYTMEAEEYTAYPSFGTSFFEREGINVTASVSEGSSSLTLGNVQLNDIGEYKCRVSLKNPKEINGKKGYVSGNGEMAGVKVFAKPTVSFSDLNLVHDTRQVQYDAFVEAQKPAPVLNETVTEEVTMWTEPESDGSILQELSENSESAVPVENSESLESESSESSESESSETESSESESSSESDAPSESRKRRQSDTLVASPEIQATSDQILNSLANCVVEGAYPEPSNIAIYIGDTKISELDDTEFEITPADPLFNTQVSVTAAIDGPEQNGKAIRCVVNDAGSMYVSEAQSDSLDIKYLPTEVTVTTEDVVYEEDSITISCQSNGNPAPTVTLMHLNDEALNSKINGSSSYTIDKVARDGDYSFKCQATSTDAEFPLFIKESDVIDVKVNYLDKPIIDVDGERKEDGDKFTVEYGKEFKLSCEADADPIATYKWFKGTEHIGSANEFTINTSEWSDSGDYHCEASNGGRQEKSKKSRVINIQVQGQCEVTDITVNPSKADKDGKQSATLTCEINNAVQPACKIDWIYPKDVFKSVNKNSNQLVLKDVNTIDDSLLLDTVVTCQASNEFTSYKPARVLQGKEIAKQIDSQDGGFPWMYIGIGVLILVVIFIYMSKRKSKDNTPGEETEKINQQV